MKHQLWQPDNLQRAFPEIPASCSRILKDTASSLKEESEMKKRNIPRLVLAAALVTICLMGAALAAFAPQITSVFGSHYGKDMQDWLEKGDIALSASSIQVEGITFTLDEVVYRSQGLYGMGTITPGEGVVLLSEDGEVSDAYGYAVSYGIDEAPEGSPSIQEKAQQDGSAIKQAGIYLKKIGVDDGILLEPDGWGKVEYPQRDGSIQFLFEVSDGQVITQGEKYTIQMDAVVHQVSADGQVDYKNPVTREWTVEIQPKPFGEVTGASVEAEQTSAPAANVNKSAMQILVPEAFNADGTLPIYQAKMKNIGKGLDYTWFNQSGTAKESINADRGSGIVDFNDGGHLSWSNTTLYYEIYDGTYEAHGQLADGTPTTETLHKGDMASSISSIAGWMTHGFPGTKEVYTLESTELTNISLSQAKKKAEGLLEQLGMTGYTCTTALDMGLERIRTMGDLLNQQIDNGQLSSNAFRYDYHTATVADEGYYLQYHKFGTDGDMAGQFVATFYVTADGIRNISLWEAYEQGDILETPAKLVDAQTVAAALPGEMADSRSKDELKEILRATLTWMPTRSGKDVVLTPVWVLTYQTEEGQQQGWEDWAVFDAVSGKLLDAIFN